MTSRNILIFYMLLVCYAGHNFGAPVDSGDSKLEQATAGNGTEEKQASDQEPSGTDKRIHFEGEGNAETGSDDMNIPTPADEHEKKGVEGSQRSVSRANENNGPSGPLSAVQGFIPNLTGGGNPVTNGFQQIVPGSSGPGAGSAGSNPMLLVGAFQTMLMPMDAASMIQGMGNIINGAQTLNNMLPGQS